MLMPWGSKKKGEQVEIDNEIELMQDGQEDAPVPSFFLSRAIGWFGVAVVIIAMTLFWIYSGYGTFKGLFVGAALIGVICVANGLRSLKTAKKRDYFILRLKCVDVRALGILENLPSYINPASNTSFRAGQQVTLQTASGTNIIFTFERARKFLVGAQYDFYFHKPPEGQKLTTDMLERLCIDRALVSEEIDEKDISGEIYKE